MDADDRWRAIELVVRRVFWSSASAVIVLVANHEDRWIENIVQVFDPPAPPLVRIRACTQQLHNDQYIWLSEEWLGVVPGKARIRPICREDWRRFIELVTVNLTHLT